MKLILLGREGTVLRAACTGSMTLFPAAGRADELTDVLGADCFRLTTLLDLSKVDHMDSGGISWLLVVHTRYVESGGHLIVHSPSPRVRSTFDLLHLSTVLTVATDEAAARALVRSEAP